MIHDYKLYWKNGLSDKEILILFFFDEMEWTFYAIAKFFKEKDVEKIRSIYKNAYLKIGGLKGVTQN